MRYIDEINSFHDWLLTNSISSSARLLWFALMHYCNKTGWKREFNVAISALELDTGLSKQSIIRARNALQQSGRIIVRTRKGNQSAIYQMVPFAYHIGTQSNTQGGTQNVAYHRGTQNDTQSDTLPDTQADTQTDTLPDTQSDTIPRHRLDKTRLDRDIPPISPKGECEGPKCKPKASAKIFRKPTVEEIEAYCLERNNGIDAGEFYDFYESKGWMIGKSKMKDWKAAVRTWERGREKRQTFSSWRNGPQTAGKQTAITAVQRLAGKYAAEEGDLNDV